MLSKVAASRRQGGVPLAPRAWAADRMIWDLLHGDTPLLSGACRVGQDLPLQCQGEKRWDQIETTVLRIRVHRFSSRMLS